MPVEWHLFFMKGVGGFQQWRMNVLLWKLFVHYDNGTLCYLFYFYYNVITAKWLFSTITNRCWYISTDEIVFPLLHSGFRRNSLWINPSLTGMNPVPAMWLFWTITKRCYFHKFYNVYDHERFFILQWNLI